MHISSGFMGCKGTTWVCVSAAVGPPGGVTIVIASYY